MNNDEQAVPSALEPVPASQQTGVASAPEAAISTIHVIAPVAEAESQDASATKIEPVEGGTDETVDDSPPIEPLVYPKTATQEAEVFSPTIPKAMEREVTLAIPTTTEARAAQFLSKYPNVDMETSESGEAWGNAIAQARMTIYRNDQFRSTIDRDGANYRQSVPSEKGPLAAGVPRFKEDTGGNNWTGERAVLRVRALTGVGSIVQVPLWHSGLWITFKAPTEGALQELNRRLAEEKIVLGRQTHGLAYANSSVFFAGWLMDFALAHVYEHSLKPEILEKKSLRQRISALDMPIIAWGLACSIWPRGFPYARSVLDPATQSTKIIREMVNVGKLLWTDLSSLTPWQISHMAQRHGANMSEQSLERYHDEFTRGKGRAIQLSDQISMMVKVPTVDEHLNSGQRWINNIVAMVDKAFGMPPGDNARNQYITEQGRASNMRQFGHWVESIVVGDSAGVITHEETLEATLDALSANDEIRDAYFKGIRSFTEDSTMAVIAVPATEETDTAPLPRFPHLLPIDAMSVFFILLVQKVHQIQAR